MYLIIFILSYSSNHLTQYTSSTAAYYSLLGHDIESLSDDHLQLLEPPSMTPFVVLQSPPLQPQPTQHVSLSSNITSPLSTSSPSFHSTTQASSTVSPTSQQHQQQTSTSSSSTSSSSSPQPVSVVVDYQEVNKIDLHHRVALWLIADVLLLTPIREGKQYKVALN